MRRLILFVFMRWGIAVLFMAIGPVAGMGWFVIGALWLVTAWLYSDWLTRRILAAFVSTIPCPRCGFDSDAVSIWTSGQYTDHRERHVYCFRNPIDGSIVGHVNCPQCSSTILL